MAANVLFRSKSALIKLLSPAVRMASQLSIDPTQALLLKEQCIAVDASDHPLRSISKEDAHLLGINGQLPPLHRAFSVFLFNTRNELLMQQRSRYKITFPGQFTNSCCSHPLFVPEEMEEKDHLGIKRAARRRLQVELGIKEEDVDLSDLKVLTRIIYGAPSDSAWGEHEVDYILFIRKDLQMEPNQNEVEKVTYISLKNFKAFTEKLERDAIQLTPWFRLISATHLLRWWEQLELGSQQDYDPCIHHLTA